MQKILNGKNGSPVLVFNPVKRLIGFYHSLTAAATSFKTSNSSIYQACVGPSISSCGLYFRFLSPDMEIEQSDYGSLKLEEYDKICGITRTYYPTSKMSRKGTKYKKHSKSKQQ